MALEKHQGGWVITFTFIISFMLAVMPLPSWATTWRPAWVAMVLIYWCIATPQRVGVATGWFSGIIHDVLSDTLLGQHALGLTLIAYISLKLHQRVRIFPVWQQAFGVGVLVAINQFLDLWIRGMIGYPPTNWSFLYPALTSLLLWPWVFIILRDMRRNYQVY